MFFSTPISHLTNAILIEGLRSNVINNENQNFLAMVPFLTDKSLTELGSKPIFATGVRKRC